MTSKFCYYKVIWPVFNRNTTPFYQYSSMRNSLRISPNILYNIRYRSLNFLTLFFREDKNFQDLQHNLEEKVRKHWPMCILLRLILFIVLLIYFKCQDLLWRDQHYGVKTRHILRRGTMESSYSCQERFLLAIVQIFIHYWNGRAIYYVLNYRSLSEVFIIPPDLLKTQKSYFYLPALAKLYQRACA